MLINPTGSSTSRWRGNRYHLMMMTLGEGEAPAVGVKDLVRVGVGCSFRPFLKVGFDTMEMEFAADFEGRALDDAHEEFYTLLIWSSFGSRSLEKGKGGA